MVQSFLRLFTWVLVVVLLQASPSAGQQNANPATTEGDFVVKNFKFRSGETLPELRLHYTTLGKPVRDAQGRVINAVLILHGTGGSGHQFLQPITDETRGHGTHTRAAVWKQYLDELLAKAG